MKKVYFYKLCNPDTGEMLMPPMKATAEAIGRNKGVLLMETEEEVPESDLDGTDHYDPRKGDLSDDAISGTVAEKPPHSPSS